MRCFTGDATNEAVWAEAMAGRKADALITDPPYCILTRRRRGGDERDPKGKKIERGPLRRFDDVRSYRDFTRAWLSLAVQQLTPTAPLVVWTNLLGREPIKEVARALGYAHLRGEYVWGKRTREGNSGEELLRVVETALVLTKEPEVVTAASAPMPWAVVAGYDDEGDGAKWGSHPSHKPWGVLEPLVRAWSRPGQLVVDCFAGSGSIPSACQRLERELVAIELEPEWATRVTQRLAGVSA